MKSLNNIKSLFAGWAITMAASISLLIPNKWLSAAAFSIGLYIVLLLDLRLYTGFVPKLQIYELKKPKTYISVVLCLLFNVIGAMIAVIMTLETAIGPTLTANAKLVMSGKTNLMCAFFSAIGCGLIIGCIVNIKDKALKYIFTLPLIALFVLLKQEHCVAYIGYATYAGFQDSSFLYWILTVLGNTLGGSCFMLLTRSK